MVSTNLETSELPTGQAMVLDPLVVRVLAPNPSPFTFTGTQSYVVGGPQDCAVIDPGPDEATHRKALLAAIGGRKVAAIMCTHTHRDHSPGAAPLKQDIGAPIIGCAPLVLDDSGPRADASFDRGYAPDRVLTDGEGVSGTGWTLTAVATPGHVSNHLCYALEENGALFTGDHIMGWSTSVVVPPDGDMADYMASLQKLYERQDRVFYPAHGEAVERPRQLVRGMLGHRRSREKQILRELAKGARAIPEMVAVMYKGLDPKLHVAAGASVLAHLIDLENRGQVQRADDIWSVTD